MRRKEVRSEILKLAPDLGYVEGHFFEKPVIHTLCGFGLDYASSGAYIFKYAVPLYDRVRFLHYGFGGRLPLPEGHIDFGAGTEKDFAHEFVSRIHSYRSNWRRLSEVGCFAKYIERELVGSRRFLNNFVLRRSYAVTLAKLGRCNEAISEIDALLAMKTRVCDDVDELQLATLKAKLVDGLGAAGDLLLQWEAEARSRFGDATF